MATVICHLFLASLDNQSRLLKELETAARAWPGEEFLSVGLGRSGDNRSGQLRGKFPFQAIIPRSISLPKALPFQFIKFAEWTIRAAMCARRSGARIVQSHSLGALTAGALAKLGTRRTLIYDAHELETAVAHQGRAMTLGRVILERALMPLVDEIWVVSPSIREHYKKTYPSKAVRLVMNIPEAHSAINERTDIRSKFGIGESEKIAVYVGGLVRGRGIDVLLAAFSEPIDGWHCVFMGAGELTKKVKEASQRAPWIHFQPAVPESSVVRTIECATLSYCVIDCGVENHRYALPNKFFQSLMAGVPTMVNSASVDMQALGGQSGLVHPVNYSPEAVRSFISQFNAPRERATSSFSWESQSLYD